ncbi:hypothetical protein [Antarcticirhabdus aurantiaca]|uniref:Uncharacterized protein n=1 Tax=Antarcticirhabdus aurantiaca TaxID=2606717 RepID=A0ACD4NQ83_9HYPH|nr:hypothetical protein [Antarcticirhabdus aurantiaca]WAJ28918.1 hypothetical protein OXU80_01295 [Jeongeuplla avenae]
MSNHTVPATAEGMPASMHRAVLIRAAACAPSTIVGSVADVFAAIPSWMALKIEVHRDAAAELGRRTRELDALTRASSAIDPEAPPAWFLEAEQARDFAGFREAEAMKALLAERPRSLNDVQDRARYLVGIDTFQGQGAMIAALLASMTGGEA